MLNNVKNVRGQLQQPQQQQQYSNNRIIQQTIQQQITIMAFETQLELQAEEKEKSRKGNVVIWNVVVKQILANLAQMLAQLISYLRA